MSAGYVLLSWNEILPTKQFQAFIYRFNGPLRRKPGTCSSMFVVPTLMTWLWKVWTTCGCGVALKKHAFTLRFTLRAKDYHLSPVHGRPQNVLVMQRYAPVCVTIWMWRTMCLLQTSLQTNTFKFKVTQSSNVPNNFMLFSYVRLGGLKMSFDMYLLQK